MKVYVDIDRWVGTPTEQVETRGVDGNAKECQETVDRWRREYGDEHVRVVYREGKGAEEVC